MQAKWNKQSAGSIAALNSAADLLSEIEANGEGDLVCSYFVLFAAISIYHLTFLCLLSLLVLFCVQ